MTSTVYVPQPSMDCDGGAPLHEQVSHYSWGKKTKQKKDSRGKWHLWLWVVSVEEERLKRKTERCGGSARGSIGGFWEKIGTDSPFNLLINHANEILTGYSEAVLEGRREALVADYTLSMWRGEKGCEICC